MKPKEFPQKLHGCWHPVTYADELLTDKPMAATLLDEPVVLWRTSDGAPQAMKDVCVHRGTALSLGRLEDDCIICPYHAWRYDASGACVEIPQSEHPTIPAKARTPVYHCQEKYGLIWVSLTDPIYALPAIPELENGDWKVVNTGPFRWESDASRQVENFTDFGHFPWVHPGLLGDPSRPLVADHEVEIKDHVLHYQVVRPEAPKSDDFPVFANEETVKPERRSRYELHLPYTIVLRLGWGGSKGMVYFSPRNLSPGINVEATASLAETTIWTNQTPFCKVLRRPFSGRIKSSSSRSARIRFPLIWPTSFI